MRLIFFLLVFVNVVLMASRLLVGLPERYLPPIQSSGEQVRPPGAKLRLLGEARLLGDPVPAEPVPAQCKMAGPFANSEVAGAFVERLAALDVAASVAALKRPAGRSYWVHFPSEQSMDAAKKRLAQLHERGVDSYVITEGELKNSVSVGLFSERGSASARVAELDALGYDTDVHVVDRLQEQIWVVLGEGEEHKIGASAWKTLVEDDFSVQEQEKPCLDVASR